MVSPLARLLSVYVRLSNDERRALGRLGNSKIREIAPRRDLIHEGKDPGVVRLILDGWACRYKTLPDGRRQTLGFFIPGDLCDPNVQLLVKMDHSVAAITPLTVAEIDPAAMESLNVQYPRIARALSWNALVNASIQREWILSMGQRSAREHLAHLIAELFHRLRAIGHVNGECCDFPLTQTDLADATGLTCVHVNRVLQRMRAEGLIEIDHRNLRIPDLAKFERAGMFTPAYLHLDHEGACFDFVEDDDARGSRVMPMQRYHDFVFPPRVGPAEPHLRNGRESSLPSAARTIEVPPRAATEVENI